MKLLTISLIIGVNLGFSAITITLSPVLGDENKVHFQAEGSGGTSLNSFGVKQNTLSFSGTPFADDFSSLIDPGLTYGGGAIIDMSFPASGYIMHFYIDILASPGTIYSFQGGPVFLNVSQPFDEIFNIGTYSITGGILCLEVIRLEA